MLDLRTGLAALALLLSAGAAAAQGTLTGTVVDADTGEPMIGASVFVTELGTGAATDLDGRYTVRQVPAGSYTVQFSYIGYGAQTVENVQITSGQTTTINITLSIGAELAEVVVEAEEIIEANSEAGMLRIRAKAAQVSDAVSAETIAQSGSSDAADAMEQVTGASVVGGKYVLVRGLGDRYANTQLNGATVPTSDPDRRSVQFDLFPSDFLDNIITLKTFTPDQPGSFSGGLIDITTKSFPAEFTVRASSSGGVNTATHFGDGFVHAAGDDLGAFAFGSASRDLPAIFNDPAVAIPVDRTSAIRARNDPALAADLDATARAFDTVVGYEQGGSAPVSQGYSLSVGNQVRVAGNPLGFIASLTYDRGGSYYDGGVTGRFQTNTVDGDRVGISARRILRDSQSATEVNWGGLANVTYRFGGTNEVGVNSLYSRVGEASNRFQVGPFPEQYGIEDTTSLYVNRTSFYSLREIYSVQPRGRHRLTGLGNTEVSWSLTGSRTTQDEPDLRFFPNLRQLGADGSFSYTAQGSGFEGPQRFYRDLTESLYEARLDVTRPFRLAGRGGEVKVGGRYLRNERELNERRFQYVPSSTQTLPGGADDLGDFDAYFSGSNLGVTDTLANGRFRIGSYLIDNTVAPNNYTGSLDVPAAYVMAEVPVGPRLRVIAGARYEPTRLGVRAGFEPGDRFYTDGMTAVVDTTSTADDVLPSLNLVYAVRDDMNLRAAATRTLARPTFREIAPVRERRVRRRRPRGGQPRPAAGR